MIVLLLKSAPNALAKILAGMLVGLLAAFPLLNKAQLVSIATTIGTGLTAGATTVTLPYGDQLVADGLNELLTFFRSQYGLTGNDPLLGDVFLRAVPLIAAAP